MADVVTRDLKDQAENIVWALEDHVNGEELQSLATEARNLGDAIDEAHEVLYGQQPS